MVAINRRRFLALTGAAAVAPLAWRGTALADSKFDFARLRPQIDEKVSAYMDANGVPGVAIAIATRDSRGALQQEYFHYGMANKATGAPMDESSIVLINSVTKVFTGSLLALNVQRGAMKLDDPIQTYLATHRSGLPRDMPSQPGRGFASGYDKTGDALVTFLSGYKLGRAPGEAYEYSNYAFALLGLILARFSGLSYPDLIQSEIGEPVWPSGHPPDAHH